MYTASNWESQSSTESEGLMVLDSPETAKELVQKVSKLRKENAQLRTWANEVRKLVVDPSTEDKKQSDVQRKVSFNNDEAEDIKDE